MTRIALLLAAALLALPAATPADVQLPPVISSHMVLQRDMNVPIWGTAAPGEKITVTFRTQSKEAVADAQGKWLVRLDPLQAGGPDPLTVAGANTVKLDDVLVGEVWVGSGQSNMAGTAGGYAKNDQVLAKLVSTSYPKVRLMKVGYKTWQEATDKTLPGFSALLVAFGLPLHKDMDVPVGLMLGAVGGTPSGNWVSQAAVDADPACKQAIAQALKTYDADKAQKDYQRQLDQWTKAVEAFRAEKAKDPKAKNKREPRKPSPPAAPGQCTRGSMGNLYDAHIRPLVPFGIRGVLWDQGESGTAVTGIDQYALMGALISGWRKDWGQGEFAFLYIQKPSGGGCAMDPSDPVTCKGDKFVPLPAAPPASNAGFSRELHIRIMKHPNTAMAIATDLGPGVHPTNKSGYGARAARVAAGFVYGKKIEYYGPLYQSHQIDGAKVRVRFTHVGGGLVAAHAEKLQGFLIAGADKKFVWADATIDGESVVVSSEKVPTPVAVRYAWDRNSPWANLFNKDGLPAQTFRTDDW